MDKPSQRHTGIDGLPSDVIYIIMRGLFDFPSNPSKYFVSNLPDSLPLHFVCRAWKLAAKMIKRDLLIQVTMFIYKLPDATSAYKQRDGNVPINEKLVPSRFCEFHGEPRTSAWMLWYYHLSPRHPEPFSPQQIAESNSKEVVVASLARDHPDHEKYAKCILYAAACCGARHIMDVCGYSAETCDEETFIEVICWASWSKNTALANEITEAYQKREFKTDYHRLFDPYLGAAHVALRNWILIREWGLRDSSIYTPLVVKKRDVKPKNRR
jgi:hypothetical protein